MTILRIGLTGGIGCGKSTVCDLFAKLGVSIIDADQIAREIVAPGKPALSQLSQQFGQAVINSDGSLNRSALRTLIFENEQARQTLNAITHPLIFKEIEQQINKFQSVYCIVAVPLLFETDYQDKFDRVLVVDCDKETQIQRVSQRDQSDLPQIEAIIIAKYPDPVVSNWLTMLLKIRQQCRYLRNKSKNCTILTLN